MEARELRIGNYTYNSISKKYGAINIYDLTDISNGESSFEPIPLTPEILEGCGFNTRPETRYYIFFNEKVLFECWPLDGTVVIEGGFMPAKLKYLHQLQNLFYCLCGTELTVNLSLPKTIA